LRSFKRLLGFVDATSRITVGSTELEAGELFMRFVGALVDALRNRSNLAKALKSKPGKEAKTLEAIVAAPANAFCTQRFFTLDAFRRSGFEVRALLNEPSAAGFEYAHRHARTLSSAREHVVVYDLGGGTFDASLVRMTGTEHNVVLTAGIARLGGDDFDRVLAELVLAEAGIHAIDDLTPIEQARLLDECRIAKETLTPNTRKLSVDLDAVLGERAGKSEIAVPVTRFYDACSPLVDLTLEAMEPILARTAEAEAAEGDGASPASPESPLGDHEAARGRDQDVPSDVAGIYVVGGASALPLIARQLRTRFGRRVHRSPYPHAAVAIGLAIAGDEQAGFALSDRFSRNVGVFREEESGARATYDPIVTRDVALPKPGDPPVTISRRYRAMHDIGHYRFFECAAFDATGQPRGDIAPMTDLLFPFSKELRGSDVQLGKQRVQRLDREGPLVEERYAVDASGIVQVTIVDLESGFERTERLGV